MTAPTLQIENWPIDRLIPYARNARTHTPEQVSQIAGSMKAFGFNNPILADAAGAIIAGHGRVLAARMLNLTQVPVIILGHLTDNQKRAFMLADNKLALNAGWDAEMLKLELQALSDEAFDLDLIGFGEDELKEILAENQASLVDADAVPEPQGATVSSPGDIWVLGEHQLLCGDGTSTAELDQLLGGRQCDLVFTDLPYNVNYQGKNAHRLTLINDNLGAAFGDFLASACRSTLAVSKGPIYICMSSSELHRLHVAFSECGGHWSTYIMWVKSTFTLGRSDYQRQYEPILYGWREGGKHFWCGARNQSDVWFIDKPVANDLHPTMKPVALIERALENSSRPGDLVLDPFAGSGSTLIACERTGRQARLVEIDPQYVDVVVRRWQDYAGRAAHRQQDGRTFEDIARERA